MTEIRTSFMSGDDERQYMIREDFEIYEKRGAPAGATALHYHDFYEIIYILGRGIFQPGGQCDLFSEKRGFLLIGRNVMHKYHYVEGKHARSRRIAALDQQADAGPAFRRGKGSEPVL